MNSLRSLNHPDWIANDGRRRACKRFVRFYSQQEIKRLSPAISPASIDSKVLSPLPPSPVLERRIVSLERS